MPESTGTVEKEVSTGTETQTTETQATAIETKAEVNYQEKFNELQTQMLEKDRLLANVEQFVNTDPDVKNRLGIYKRSFEENKPYQDLLKQALEQGENESKEKPESKASQEQLNKLIESRLNQAIGPISQQVKEFGTKQMLEDMRKEIQEVHPWADPKDWPEYDKRLNAYIGDRAKELMAQNYPNMTAQQAWDAAIQKSLSFDNKGLYSLLMQDKRDAWLLSGKRQPPKLPNGVMQHAQTGAEEDILDKARKIYKGIENKPQEITKLLKEMAPQFGIDDKGEPEVVEKQLKELLKKIRN
jgi:hypothetical protein